MGFELGNIPHNKGVNKCCNSGRTHFKEGNKPVNGFQKGNIPHNKGKGKYGDGSKKAGEKACRRNRGLKYKYGITEDMWNQMRTAQDNKCAGCGDPFIESPRVDHSHITGRVRQLLCNGCNLSLGLLKESGDKLRKLAEYADKWAGM